MAQRFFSRTGFCLWIGAMIGALCVLPFVNAVLPELSHEAPEPPGPPSFALVAMSIGQTALLLGFMCFAGLWAARKLGMGAPVLDAWLGGEDLTFDLGKSARTATMLGIAAGILLIVLDLAIFVPLDPDGIGRIVHIQPPAWMGFLASFTGGITEEVQLRLFLLSFLALGIRLVRDRLFSVRDLPLPPPVFWLANIVVAVLFGLGHLPITAALVTLTPIIVVRAIVLNGIVGVLTGFLFWRRGIEKAMVCHFSADVVLHVIPPLVGY
jgi:hypothetical protein